MKCLICKKAKAHSRGLCSADYSRVNRLIKSNNTTWDILVTAGKALPAHANSKSRQLQEVLK